MKRAPRNTRSNLKLNLAHLMRLLNVPQPVKFLMSEGFTETEARNLMDDTLTCWKPKHLDRLGEILGATLNQLAVYDGPNKNHPMAQVPAVKVTDLMPSLRGLKVDQALKVHEEVRRMVEGFRKENERG